MSGEELIPYLNPEYWSGHSIGYGEPLDPWPEQPPFRFGMSRSRKDLEGRLASMEKAVPIERYADGQIFDISDYDPGTVVLLREESLTGRPDKLKIGPTKLKGHSLHNRPFDVSPSFGPISTTETVTDGNITYFTAAKWGIVVQNKKRASELHTVSTGLTDRKPNGGFVIANPWLLTIPTPIEIGTTKHYVSKKTKSERLQRINVLDVIAYGETQ